MAESARGNVERLEPSKADRAASRRVAESKATVPHLYMSIDIDVTDAQDLVREGRDGPGLFEIVLRGVALALGEVPRLNGAYRDGAPEHYSRVNLGVVADRGSVVPTIFDADRKSLDEITVEWRRLEERARDGSITAAELSGGTFTVTEAGPLVGSFAPVIHGGQAANLGLGGFGLRVMPTDRDVLTRHVVTATLVADARMIDARNASDFLAHLNGNLIVPQRLAI